MIARVNARRLAGALHPAGWSGERLRGLGRTNPTAPPRAPAMNRSGYRRIPELADLLLAELDYARHPHAHEGTAPRYGALIATGQRPTSIVEPVSFIDVGPIPLGVLRRLADGRSSFVVHAVGSGDRLACFERTASSSPPRCTWPSPPARTWCSGSVRAGCDSPRSRESPRGTGSDGPRNRSASASPSASPRRCRAPNRPCSPTSSSSPRTGSAPAGSAPRSCGASTATPASSAVSGSRRRWRSRRSTSPTRPTSRHCSTPSRSTTGPPSSTPAGTSWWSGCAFRARNRCRAATSGRSRGTRHTSALRFSADVPNTVVFIVSSGGTLTVARNGRRLDTD